MQLIAEHNNMTKSFKTTERDMNKDILEYLLVRFFFHCN